MRKVGGRAAAPAGLRPLTWTWWRGSSAVFGVGGEGLGDVRVTASNAALPERLQVSEVVVVVRLVGMLWMLTVVTAGTWRFGSA